MLQIQSIENITNASAGGKALGLQQLLKLGLKVPDSVVLIRPQAGQITDEILTTVIEKLGKGPKAVRSSAGSEDGVHVSFAGQFETFLNLTTLPEIKQAIIDCIEAAGAARVRSYSGNLAQNADLRISVIIQNMVKARVSGVVFTANPVTNRRDKVLVNAVPGTGDELVSGMKDAHSYEVYPSQSNVAVEISKNGHLLNEIQLREIVAGSKIAEKHMRMPVDLEWAIDAEGSLSWLQLRPVTTLDDVHFNELDSEKRSSDKVWTLGNIGEMMPGVATPLTWSVSAWAIDYGMVMLADRAGVFRIQDRTEPRYIQLFYNRLFINMSHMMDYPKKVWLNTAEDVMFALSGKVFPGFDIKPDAILPVRIVNFFRQMFNTLRGQHYLDLLKRLEAGFHIHTQGTLEELYTRLTDARLQLGIGFGYHLGTSAQSGTLYSLFMRIMTGDKRKPDASDHHTATMLLLDIPEIESADAIKSLERFALLIRSDKQFAARFISCSTEQALALLLQQSPANIREAFSSFLQRHGHRCVRESELREKPWEDHPQQLIQSLQTRVKSSEVQRPPATARHEINNQLKTLPLVSRLVLRGLVPMARKAVARREITKGLSIRMVHNLRKGYRELASRMVDAKMLNDPDLIFFLTHDEIGQFLMDRRQEWVGKATRRRELLPLLDRLTFDEISFGIPEPMEDDDDPELLEGQLKGIPVSSGIVEGRVHLIHDLESAEKLREGEIMVAAFTDIGWTPYFSIIAGLITEIGSPLSHGAVVAREYGIPAVVGVKGARRVLKDGDLVRIYGNLGIVEKIG